ncbi:MAG: DUF2157 domain-containing protein [Dehalococcoidia bacterium]|nr:DUF2157 domain-containing protein [Dehalococcoidia bacterium]
MPDVEEHLERWLEAGVIHDSDAERIRAFERQRPAGPARPSGERPGAIEALLYLGVVVVSVGVFALIEQRWPDLDSWARVMAIGVPTLLALALGAGLHTTEEPGLHRAAQLAWFVAVGLFAGMVGVILNEYEPAGITIEDDPDGLLTVTSATALLALILWVFSPAHPQVVALGAALFALGQAVGNWPDEFSQVLAGMLIFGFGAAGLALTEAGMFGPRFSGRLIFGVLCAVGPYEAGFTENGMVFELMVFAVGGALIALGVMRASFTLLAVGVIASFVGLVTFIFEHFEDRLGAPVALMISGGALIAGALLLVRLRSAEHIRKLR